MVFTEDEKFIYVFSREARDGMLASGYRLIKSDEQNGRYIFENDPRLTFSHLNISCIKSNTMTF